MEVLNKKFYSNNTENVAKDLIGKTVIRVLQFDNIIYRLVGIIVETEAYGHDDDPASHAYSRVSNRNRVMFENIGCAYVYLIYGKFFCFNITARAERKRAGAILIRSLYPQEGIKIMSRLRNTNDIKNLTNGPSKLAQALSIDKEINGIDLTQKNNKIWIEDGIKPHAIGCTTRIGISRAKEIPWRFVLLHKTQKSYVQDHYVSKKIDIIKIIKNSD